MIGDVEAETFMIRLMLGVIGSACVLFLCRTCYNVSRINRHAAAEAKTKAERGARLADVFVCESYQDTAMAQEHGEHAGHDDQFWQQVDEQLRVQRDASVKRRFSRAVPDKLGPGPQSSTGPSRQCRLSMRMARWAFPPSGLPAALSSTHSSIGASRRSSTGKAAALAEPKIPPVPLLRWNCMTLSGPPGSSATVEVPADEKPTKHQSTQIDNNRFASPPLVVLATGGARVATIKRLRRCFMLHSVVLAATADALEAVLLEAAELRKLKHHCLLRMFAVVADQPYGEVGLLSELTTGSLASLLDTSPVRLTWANGLLALATDVAAGLAYLHGLGLHHGRLFAFNVMVTSAWHAKLSEYALGRYLALSHCGQSEASGYHSLPSVAHGKDNLAASIFIPPEKFSGKMQGKRATIQSQRLPAAKAVAHEPQSRDFATGRQSPCANIRTRRTTSESMQRLRTMAARQSTAMSPDAQGDEPHPEPKAMVSTTRANGSVALGDAAMGAGVLTGCSSEASAAHEPGKLPEEKPKEDPGEARLAEQHGDAWAFGCLLASLALHQKRAKEHPANAGLRSRSATRSGATAAASDCQLCNAAAHGSESGESSRPPAAQASSRRLNRKKSDELDGWSEYESGSKDRPGRCADRQSSQLKLSAAEALPPPEGRPHGRRKSVDLKFEALGELSRALNRSRKSRLVEPLEKARRRSFGSLGRVSERTSQRRSSDDQLWPDALLMSRSSVARRSSSFAEQDTPEPPLCARPSTLQPGRLSIDHLLGRASMVEAGGAVLPPSAPPSPPTSSADVSATLPIPLAEGSTATAEQGRPDGRSTKLGYRLKAAQPFAQGRFAQDRLPFPERGGLAAVMLAAKALPAPAPLTPYLMMLRVCQGKASPLDGVTPSCCPRPLLQLATQCCALVPEERPDLAAVLEQLHDKVLRSVDSLAHAGARRPLSTLEGWRDAAERTANKADPARTVAVAPHSPPVPPTTYSVDVAPTFDC